MTHRAVPATPFLNSLHWRRVSALAGIVVPVECHDAFDYLESVGFRFCSHFGIKNAIDLARRDWAQRKARTVIH